MTPPSQRATGPKTPGPSTPQDPPQAAPSPLFVPPTTEPMEDQLTRPDQGSDAGPGIGFADEMPPEDRSSSAPPSTIDRKGIKAAIEAGFHLVTNEANRALTRDDIEREAGLFAAEDDEAAKIADPLSKIAVRHNPGGAAANPDLADLIAALLVLAGYLSRNLRMRRDLKRAKAEGRAFLHPEGGVQIVPPQAPAPASEDAA